jgi:hypothetical protein
MTRAERFKALPLHRKLLFYAIAAVTFTVVIAWISLIHVTLSKAFELADPWDTVKVFLIFTGTMIAFYRLCGLHRPY